MLRDVVRKLRDEGPTIETILDDPYFRTVKMKFYDNYHNIVMQVMDEDVTEAERIIRRSEAAQGISRQAMYSALTRSLERILWAEQKLPFFKYLPKFFDKSWRKKLRRNLKEFKRTMMNNDLTGCYLCFVDMDEELKQVNTKDSNKIKQDLAKSLDAYMKVAQAYVMVYQKLSIDGMTEYASQIWKEGDYLSLSKSMHLHPPETLFKADKHVRHKA